MNAPRPYAPATLSHLAAMLTVQPYGIGPSPDGHLEGEVVTSDPAPEPGITNIGVKWYPDAVDTAGADPDLDDATEMVWPYRVTVTPPQDTSTADTPHIDVLCGLRLVDAFLHSITQWMDEQAEHAPEPTAVHLRASADYIRAHMSDL